MKKKIIFSALILIGSIIFLSCKKDEEAYTGPLLCPTTAFSYTQPFTLSASTVNLNTTPLVISAEYNEELDWTIIITGQISGAVKEFTGRGKAINISWKGNADEGPFFANETCDITFTLACSEAQTQSVNITANNFTNYGLLMNDFDGHGNYPAMGSSTYGIYLDAAQTGVKNTPVPLSPQGGNYFRLVGNSSGVPVWGFGGFASALSLTSLGVNDPSKVYFNILVNSNGVSNSDLSVTLTEGSAKTWHTTVNWTGWKMVSFPLSEAGIIEANKVTGIEFYLGAAPVQGTQAELNMDFVIFTVNTPYYY